MKKMLLNATHQEELRVAIVDGQELVDLDIDSTISNLRKGNIYKGVVTRVEPSLEAAFVDYGSARQGFLPLKEISKMYFTNYDNSTAMSDVKIKDVLKEGQELIVQIDKDERGNKGAALSTFISLAGRFIVLMPNNGKGGGISRRISGDERQELKEKQNQLNVPKEHALIFRTAGIGRSLEEFQWDLDYLMRIWTAITTSAELRPGPFLIYQENNVIVRALRDYMNSNIDEFLVDDEEVYNRAKRFMEMIMPQNINKLKLYQDSVPLYSRYQVEMQIEAAFSRHVRMKSGAELVIDHTEAMTTIDVNSAKATSGSDIEETALKTNLEAVDEIAKQLRIRDIGGLVVIDFIDMIDSKNQRAVEKQMAVSLKADRARIQIGKISKFGLLEMSRQRLRSALGEANYVSCPHCQGTGLIRSIPSSALSILRVIEEEALKENTETVHAYLPLEIATYLLNEKRHEVSLIERRLATTIVLLPSADMRVPNFHIKRLRAEDISREKADRPSYRLKDSEATTATDTYTEYRAQAQKTSANNKEALIGITDITPSAPPPMAKVESKGFIQTILGFFGLGDTDEQRKAKAKKKSDAKRNQSKGKADNKGKPRRNNNNNRNNNKGAKAQSNGDQNNNGGDNTKNTKGNQRRKQNNRPKNNNRNNASRQKQNDNNTGNDDNANAGQNNSQEQGNNPNDNAGNNNNRRTQNRRKPQNRNNNRKPQNRNSQNDNAGNNDSSANNNGNNAANGNRDNTNQRPVQDSNKPANNGNGGNDNGNSSQASSKPAPVKSNNDNSGNVKAEQPKASAAPQAQSQVQNQVPTQSAPKESKPTAPSSES